MFNVFIYKNFLFFVGVFGMFRFNFMSLLLNTFLSFFQEVLYFKLLSKNVKNLNKKLYSININFFKQLDFLHIKKLFLFGVGFRCWLFKNSNNIYSILLKLGFSRDICLEIPLAIKVICLKSTLIFLKSNNRFVLELFAGRLCSLKKLNLYKGKGLMNNNKKIVVKLGKKA